MSLHSLVPSPSHERLHGLDAVRAVALIAGVVLHASMAYIPGAQYFWPTADTAQGVAAGMLFYMIHLFRMVTFFLIAGFFGRLALQRVGEMAFVRDRTRRILLPLLAGWPLVMTGIVAALVLTAYLKSGGRMPPQPSTGPKFTPDDFPLTHLWFLYALTLLYAATLIVRRALKWVDPRDRLPARIDRALPWLTGRWAAFALAVPGALALWAQAKWYFWFGIPTPDQSLIPNVAASVSFGVAFGAGWLLARRREIISAWQFHWQANLVIAAVAAAVCLSIAGLTPKLAPAAWDINRAVYAYAYATASWASSLALIGWALRYLDRHSPIRRYLADASYWIYLAHLPIVMTLQGVASTLILPWPVKLLWVITGTLALCLGSYHLLVRGTWIGAWLNGRRIGVKVPA